MPSGRTAAPRCAVCRAERAGVAGLAVNLVRRVGHEQMWIPGGKAARFAAGDRRARNRERRKANAREPPAGQGSCIPRPGDRGPDVGGTRPQLVARSERAILASVRSVRAPDRRRCTGRLHSRHGSAPATQRSARAKEICWSQAAALSEMAAARAWASAAARAPTSAGTWVPARATASVAAWAPATAE